MKPLKILVVDDSELMVRKLETLLTEMGHRVVATANTGQQAIVAYSLHKPDLMTLDITMPDMDGISAAKVILEHFTDARIIMVTSNGLQSMVVDALKAGAKGYVLKPIRPDKLAEQIDRIMSRHPVSG